MSVLNQSGEEQVECPLCMEPLEVDDLNFFPCTCGYQICRFCWHRIRTDENGLCPACRKAYSEDPADFIPLSQEQIAKLKAEKRQRDQQRKAKLSESRKHLASVRVVQRNLVFVVGLPLRLADSEVLKKHEYFGKFGKIHKVVINQSTSYAGSQGPSASAYVTYMKSDDALRAIQSVNNITIDGRLIKSSLGTTKYCSHFMKNQPCPKPDCMYLHDFGDPEASFTKEQMHAGKHQEYEKKLHEALLQRTNQQKQQEQQQQQAQNCINNNNNVNNKDEVKPTTKVKENTTQQQQQHHHQHNNNKDTGTNKENWPQLDNKDKKQVDKDKTNSKIINNNNNKSKSINNKIENKKINKDNNNSKITSLSSSPSSSSTTSSSSSINTTTIIGNNNDKILSSSSSSSPEILKLQQIIDDNSSFFSHNTFQKISNKLENNNSLIDDKIHQLHHQNNHLNHSNNPHNHQNQQQKIKQHDKIKNGFNDDNDDDNDNDNTSEPTQLTDNLPNITSNEDWAAAFGFTTKQQQQIHIDDNGLKRQLNGFGPFSTNQQQSPSSTTTTQSQQQTTTTTDYLSTTNLFNMSKLQENLLDVLSNNKTTNYPLYNNNNNSNGLEQNMSKFFMDFHRTNGYQQQQQQPSTTTQTITNGYYINPERLLLLQQKKLVEEQLMNLGLKQHHNHLQQQQQNYQQQNYFNGGDNSFLLHNNQFTTTPTTSNKLLTNRNQNDGGDELDFDPFQETQKALAELMANEQNHKSHSDRNQPLNGFNHSLNQNNSLPPPPPGFLQPSNHMNSFGSKILPFLNMTNSPINSTTNPQQQQQQHNWSNFLNPQHKGGLSSDWKEFDSAILTTSRHYPINLPPARDHFLQQQQPPSIHSQQQQPQNGLRSSNDYSAFTNFAQQLQHHHHHPHQQQQQQPPLTQQQPQQPQLPNYNNFNNQPNFSWFNSELNAQISSPPGFRTNNQTTKQQEC